MKKTIKSWLALMAVVVVLTATFIPCFAANMDKDGVYSVPVTMLDPSKDKESMGNRFIEHTAMIEVKDGQKTITVLMPKESDLVFCYYTDGSVKGASKEAVKVNNVKFDGKTYPVGYTFPLVKDNGPVGLYFVLSFLGIKPSARLSPDYSQLKLVEAYEEQTTAEETTVNDTPEETTIAEVESVTVTDEADVVEAVSENTETVSEIIGGADEATTILVAEESATIIPVWVYIAAAVVVIAVIVIIIFKKKSK